jgi:ATP/maltotriose-dependent transcriptional regulator MalT/DNA-binding SARP family transcriptional activator
MILSSSAVDAHDASRSLTRRYRFHQMPEAVNGRALIQRKLRLPPVQEDVLERPRLDRLLGELMDRHATVIVSATAGAGKTTAVVQAMRGRTQPVAWLTVDRTDRAPGRLLVYLEAALAVVVPVLRGVASSALAAGVPHAEAAGLLADAVGEAPVILVLDELERLADAAEAWAVVEALLRYAPASMRTVLLSRRDLPTTVQAALTGRPATLGEVDLAFTASEAEAALAHAGSGRVDARGVVRATGGWVTGVLFEAWRLDEHVTGTGGEADPLHGYLAAHILGEIGAEDRDFLVSTAVLDEVTVERAEALGLNGAGERLRALRVHRLPVTWDQRGRAMRCHSRFREYLVEVLESLGSERVRSLRRAHGLLLAREGHDEEATEELLRGDASADALAPAERAITRVIGRLDFAVADRWLAALADVAPSGASEFTNAELMLAMARDDPRRAERIADQLEELGERERLARGSQMSAALMAWCYAHVGRLGDSWAVLDGAMQGPEVDAIRYGLEFLDSSTPPVRPEPTGGPMDVVIHGADYLHAGRVTELAQQPASRWTEAVMSGWRIGALQLAGRTELALELYEAAQQQGLAALPLDVPVGPELLMDAGRLEEARQALARGRRLAVASGSPFWRAVIDLTQAKLHLRFEHDVAAAQPLLDRLEAEQVVASLSYFRELISTRRGFAALLDGDDAAARAHLQAAVDGMVAGGRLFELPTAAVYLAEAQWRAGDENAADRAADVALAAAQQQGSNHVLLLALRDFPAVLSRRLDAEPSADSPWHELGRALLAQGSGVNPMVGVSVRFEEFGRPRILVDGEEVRPRIVKCYELLAYLAARHGAPADRDELLDALFGGRADEAARRYLRQTIHHLRQALPYGGGLVADRHRVALAPGVAITSESARLETGLAEAARLRGAARLAATQEALSFVDRGAYLPGGQSPWTEERRRYLEELATDARYEASVAALDEGRYDEALRLSQAVLGVDPLRETAWRLAMRIANALGDDDGVIAAFHGCERALAEIGTAPAASTRQLLETLRH